MVKPTALLLPFVIPFLGCFDLPTADTRRTAEVRRPTGKEPGDAIPKELLTAWSACSDPDDVEKMTEVQFRRYWRQQAKSVRGKPVKIAGRVDSVEDGMVSGSRTLYIEQPRPRLPFGDVQRIEVPLRGKKLRAVGASLSIDEVVVVTGTFKNCAPVFGTLYADIKPDNVETLTNFSTAKPQD